MKLRFTEHANSRLEERSISSQEIEKIIQNPKWSFYDLQDSHRIAIGKRNGHHLIVVYDLSQEFVEIVTVIDISKKLEKVIRNRIESRRWVEL